MTTANELTAKKAKANIKSLLDKVNKETGKEHANLSEGVETLVLGFGTGDVEDYDGTMEFEGDLEEDEPSVTDYYEKGFADGIDSLPDGDAVAY